MSNSPTYEVGLRELDRKRRRRYNLKGWEKGKERK
jgi:hypothetical protein